jgi:hypothetical protein
MLHAVNPLAPPPSTWQVPEQHTFVHSPPPPAQKTPHWPASAQQLTVSHALPPLLQRTPASGDTTITVLHWLPPLQSMLQFFESQRSVSQLLLLLLHVTAHESLASHPTPALHSPLPRHWTLQSEPLHAIGPVQLLPLLSHLMSHVSAAQTIAPVHEPPPVPQLSVQELPPQRMSPLHVLPPVQSTVQTPAVEQSIREEHWPEAHFTWQLTTFAGHTTPPSAVQSVLLQSITHAPPSPALHVPPAAPHEASSHASKIRPASASASVVPASPPSSALASVSPLSAPFFPSLVAFASPASLEVASAPSSTPVPVPSSASPHAPTRTASAALATTSARARAFI